MKRRIAMVLCQLRAGVGGCETQALRLAAALQDRGHEVEILTTRPRGTPAEERLGGVRVRRLHNFGDRRVVWRLGIYRYALAVGAELCRSRPDVVHAHQLFHSAVAAIASRPWHGRPVLVKAATAGAFGDVQQMKSGAAFPGCRPFLRVALRADRIVAISEEIAGELRGVGVTEERIARIPNGVILPCEVVTEATRAAARASLGLVADDEVLVYVGRCRAQKAPDLLLSTWRRLRARPRCVLLIVGEGFVEDTAFRAAASESGRLRLCGRVNDVPRYLAAADALLFPSRGEGLSNAVLEAMAHGVPIVASGIAANAELLREGAGLLAAPEDAIGLATLAGRVLEDQQGRQALARAARRRAEDFDLRRVAAAYEGLYEELLSTPAVWRDDREAATLYGWGAEP